MDDVIACFNWFLQMSTTLLSSISTWGFIGIAIIAAPFIRRMMKLIYKIFFNP